MRKYVVEIKSDFFHGIAFVLYNLSFFVRAVEKTIHTRTLQDVSGSPCTENE